MSGGGADGVCVRCVECRGHARGPQKKSTDPSIYRHMSKCAKCIDEATVAPPTYNNYTHSQSISNNYLRNTANLKQSLGIRGRQQ